MTLFCVSMNKRTALRGMPVLLEISRSISLSVIVDHGEGGRTAKNESAFLTPKQQAKLRSLLKGDCDRWLNFNPIEGVEEHLYSL